MSKRNNSIQPLSYQKEDCSCWVTSVLNGLVYLLEKPENIPNYVARMLYAGSSNSGTENQQAEILVGVIGRSRIGVKLRIVTGKKVTGKFILSQLKNKKKKRALVADTFNGKHSVLLVGLDASNNVLLFDPWWENIIASPRNCKPNFKRVPDGRLNNAVVSIAELSRTSNGGKSKAPFCMGLFRNRYLVIMEKV
jgi:hypothetical protein